VEAQTWDGGSGDVLIGAPIGVRRREAWGTNGRGVKWLKRDTPVIGLIR
jgi:hypothetical protein